MEISTRKVNDVLVVDMAGELVTQTSGYASDEMVQIAKSGNSKVLLNLDKLEYVSSAGLRIILVAAKLLRTSGGEMSVKTFLSTRRWQVGGLGIHLVRNLVDEATYQRRVDRNVLTLVTQLGTEQNSPDGLR